MSDSPEFSNRVEEESQPLWSGEPGSWRQADASTHIPTMPTMPEETQPLPVNASGLEADKIIKDFMSNPGYKEWPRWYRRYRANKAYDEFGIVPEDRTHPEYTPTVLKGTYLPRPEVRLKYAVLANLAPLATAVSGLVRVIKRTPSYIYRTAVRASEADIQSRREQRTSEKQAKAAAQAERAEANRQRWQNAKH